MSENLTPYKARLFVLGLLNVGSRYQRTHLRAMFALATHGNLSARRLGDECKLSKNTIESSMHRLACKGIVVRYDGTRIEGCTYGLTALGEEEVRAIEQEVALVFASFIPKEGTPA